MRTAPEVSADPKIQIRLVGPSDQALLRQMYEGFEPRPASLGLPPRTGIDRWLDQLRGAENFVAVAEDGTPVGHAVLCREGKSAEVAVFVRQECRVRGIGRRLLDAVVQRARRLALGSLWGTTDLDNVPMLRLADAAGFVQDEKDPSRFEMVLKPARECFRS